MRTVPGSSDVYPEQVTSGQYLNIEVDRTAAARYGIDVGEVQQVIEHAVGETVLTTTSAVPRAGCAIAPRTGRTRRLCRRCLSVRQEALRFAISSASVALQ